MRRRLTVTYLASSVVAPQSRSTTIANRRPLGFAAASTILRSQCPMTEETTSNSQMPVTRNATKVTTVSTIAPRRNTVGRFMAWHHRPIVLSCRGTSGHTFGGTFLVETPGDLPPAATSAGTQLEPSLQPFAPHSSPAPVSSAYRWSPSHTKFDCTVPCRHTRRPRASERKRIALVVTPNLCLKWNTRNCLAARSSQLEHDIETGRRPCALRHPQLKRHVHVGCDRPADVPKVLGAGRISATTRLPVSLSQLFGDLRKVPCCGVCRKTPHSAECGDGGVAIRVDVDDA